MEKKGKFSLIMMYIIVFAIVAIVTVAAVYYLFFSFKDNNQIVDNSPGTYTVNDELLNRLLKEVSIANPALREGGIALATDLTDDEKLYIIIQDLIETGTVQIPEDATKEGSIVIALDTILERAQKVWNTTTYDYYPDEVKYNNYYFKKQDKSYVGYKTMEDEEYGVYEYINTQFGSGGNEIYIDSNYYYYYDVKGAYADSSKNTLICEGKGCGQALYDNGDERENMTLHKVRATFKINHGNFIFVSATVS